MLSISSVNSNQKTNHPNFKGGFNIFYPKQIFSPLLDGFCASGYMLNHLQGGSKNINFIYVENGKPHQYILRGLKRMGLKPGRDFSHSQSKKIANPYKEGWDSLIDFFTNPSSKSKSKNLQK